MGDEKRTMEFRRKHTGPTQVGDRHDNKLSHLPIWIQIWGLLFNLLLEEVGREIGSGMGQVVEVDTKALTVEQARFIRVRVEIPLNKPIHRGGSVLNPGGNKTRIGFKYERLVGLCFQCG